MYAGANMGHPSRTKTVFGEIDIRRFDYLPPVQNDRPLLLDSITYRDSP
jgi:hypothetical protein